MGPFWLDRSLEQREARMFPWKGTRGGAPTVVGAIKEPRKGGFRVGGCSNTDLCLQASPMLRAGSLAVAAF